VELDNIVDISYAVSPEEAQGRKRMKNMATGEVFWAEEIHAKPVMLPKDQITPLEDHVVIKPKDKKHGA
jgi:hypothetical protein